jgi:UrcA family protein
MYTGTLGFGIALLSMLCSAMDVTFAAAADSEAQKKSDQMSQVKIEASRDLKRKIIDRDPATWAPIEEIDLSRRVSFADLDLSTPNGKKELQRRIEQTAKEACQEIEMLYPAGTWLTDERDCTWQAIKDAEKQAQAAIAAAESRKQENIRSATAAPPPK